jgi:hypothetical protein
MDSPKKCKHESCVCVVPNNGEFGAYCSAHCRDAKHLTELRCECGHAGCVADAATRVPSDRPAGHS